MNPDSKRERPLKERLKEAVRGEILAAAERVLGVRGLGAAKMEEIALAAGVSVGTLYNHFEDREALLEALLDQRRADVRGRLDEALEQMQGKPFREQLTRALEVVMEHFGQHRAFFAMLMEEELRSGRGRVRGQTAFKEFTARFQRLVERGLEQGALRREGSELYPALLMGFLKGVFTQIAHDETWRLTPELVGSLARLFLEGAGVRS